MPSELPTTTVFSSVPHPVPQTTSSMTPVPRSTDVDSDRFTQSGPHYPVTIYSPQLGRHFTLSSRANLCGMRVSRGFTPPGSVARRMPVSKLITATKFSSCTNSPLATHKPVTENVNGQSATHE
ncbi:unnamed protein product [Echinostoma caproni]|uniref:Uncharacterized protein n=1 Tax=Echinostoma caproni TaxID=27848 RepID=A0A183A507_9TREM|nr:unnamed protein product [Echinostoma caproni]